MQLFGKTKPLNPNQAGSPMESCGFSSRTLDTGVLIVGGGPAGLATAIALRLRGVECAVVEARAPGIDKACGEGLMPGALKSLARLGIPLSESDGHSLCGICFENSSNRVEARFPCGAGLGIRRPLLHMLLARRAEELGVRVLWNSHVQLPSRGPNGESSPGPEGLRTATVNGRAVRFRWLVGADGRASATRRWAGLERARKQSLRYGFRTHYRVAPWSQFVEVHWSHRGQLYITPVARDCVSLVYIARDTRFDRAAILDWFPAVARRLKAGSQQREVVSQPRGGVSATCKLHRIANDFVALVGDASGSVDVITGEGLATSFGQALALADSIVQGSLAPYRVAHRRIARLPHSVAALALTLDRWPALQMRAMRTLASNPAIFQDLLCAHIGVKSLASVLLRRAPRFGWSLLCKGTTV